MPSALSVDLRERVVAAMAEGASCHGAAARFGVSASSASRGAERVRPTICLHELCAALGEQGVTTSTSGLSRFFARHAITRKRGHCTRPSRSERT